MSQSAGTPNRPTAHDTSLQPFSVPGNIRILLPEETSSQVKDFCSACGWSRVLVHAASSPDLTRLLYETDALLIWVSASTLPLLRAISAAPAFPARAPVIAICTTPSDEAASADFLSPPQSWMIRHNLQQALALRERFFAERKRAAAVESALEQLNQRKSELDRYQSELDLMRNVLTNNIAHELKTPMLQIKGAITELAARLPEKPVALDFAVQATSRLESILLDVTMLATGLDVRLQPVVAQDVVAQALRERSRHWSSQTDDDRIVFRDECEGMIINADHRALSIVLQHLIDNAIKFDNTGSPIVVRLARRQNLVWFSVEDSGRGIPVNLQDKIFEPFFQIDSSERRSAGGAGLGLALVTIILNKHNTEIKLKSEPGSGSIFSFALPILNLSP